MQVFLPCPDFPESVRMLDSRRLQKQGVEALQILLVIFDVPLDDGRPRVGHRNHPCVRAWRPYPLALARYALAIVEECKRRGIKADKVEARVRSLLPPGCDLESAQAPPFVGDPQFHRSHRCRLLQKSAEDISRGRPNWYAQWRWPEASEPGLAEEEYLWPEYTDDEGRAYRLVRVPKQGAGSTAK